LDLPLKEEAFSTIMGMRRAWQSVKLEPMASIVRTPVDSVDRSVHAPPHARAPGVVEFIRRLRRNDLAVDIALALVFFAMSTYFIRVLQLQYAETVRDASSIRPSAEAAAAMDGKAGEGGKRLLEILAEFPKNINIGLGYSLASVSCFALALRRRLPGIVHLLGLLTFAAAMWFVPAIGQLMSIVIWISLYSFAAHSRWSDRTRYVVLFISTLVILLLLSGVVQNMGTDPAAISIRDKVANFISNGLLYGSAIALALSVRRLKYSLATLELQTKTLQEQQLVLEQTATLNERVRIAREVHDVVAHHVSVMGLHAGAARMTLGSEPSMVGASLETIERAGRDAVTDLHRLLSFLRSDQVDTPPSISTPQPTLSTLPSLFDNHREAGFDVVPRISADLQSASPAIELAVFRIVQEALTNSRKHGHQTDETLVDIWSDNERIRIRIANIPTPTRLRVVAPLKMNAILGKGHGIRGMQERALLHGGEFSAAPSPDGGFVVRAVLPLRG
jgi:signal transduction histidine kinase